MKVVKQLYCYILKSPSTFVIGTFSLILGLVLTNAAPFFVKWLTQAVQSRQMNGALILIVIFGITLLLSNILENLGYFITDKNMVRTSTMISHLVLTHIHNLDFAYHTNKSSGKLVSLMKRGDDAFFSFYDIFNRQFLSILLSFIIMIIAFSQLQIHYILYILVLIIISMFISYFLVKVNIKKRNIFNKSDDELSSARVDNLVNFDTVKYFANEEYEQKRFSSLLKIWDKTLQEYFLTFRYFDAILGNILNAALIGIMTLALFDLQKGFISFPEFLLVITFSMSLFPRMMSFLYNLRELAKRYSDLKDYLALLDEEVIVADPTHPVLLPTGGQISFKNVSFKYDNAKSLVLRKFNLKIEQGEAIAFVGYSGAGKTTIAKLLMRMYDPSSGSIEVNGINIRNVTKAHLRTKVGIVPQDPLLFNNTVKYNIAYAKENSTESELFKASEDAKAHDFIGKLSSGYETVVGERGIKLSGGQRQRLAIARVLLEKPEIIIFDEATSALDSESEKIIQASFWNLVRDKKHIRTAIIIAHRLSTIMKADRIIVMDKGVVVDIGTHDELIKQTKGIYYKLWTLQRNGFIGVDQVSAK